jgi:hypothetical protein
LLQATIYQSDDTQIKSKLQSTGMLMAEVLQRWRGPRVKIAVGSGYCTIRNNKKRQNK